MTALHHLSAVQQRAALRAGEISATELTAHYAARIERINPEVNAFVTVTADQAQDAATRLEASGPGKAPAVLWGMPLADKDLQSRAGVPTGFGSRLMAGFVPDTSDELVRTLDAAGAISLGKTATPEFGLSSHTETATHPATRNPWDTSCGPGGSSGGAAVAVAAGMLPFAPGSDGGGSVRIPAAACGLVGLKPSRGLVPGGSGLDSLAGLSVAGPLARTVADAALLLEGMIGSAPFPFTVRSPRPEPGALLTAAASSPGTLSVAVLTQSPWDDAYDIQIAPEARAALDVAIRALDAAGHHVAPLSLEPAPDYPTHFRTIWQAGAASIPAEGDQLGLVEPLTAWLIDRGRSLSARTLAEALAGLAAFERSILRQFAVADIVLTPALALTPRPIGWYDAHDGERNFAQQVQYTPFTSFVNVCGLPAIALPVWHDEAPMGVQLIGRPGAEATLLGVGAQLEQVFRWQDRHPPQW